MRCRCRKSNNKLRRKNNNKRDVLQEGDLISLDGTLGEVYIGELKSEPPKPSEEFNTLMEMV